MNFKYKNFKIISSKNFVIFKIDDFLNHDQYQLLYESFNIFEITEMSNKDNLKFAFNSSNEVFEKLKNIPKAYDLIKEIRAKTLNILIKKLFFLIWKARNFNFVILLKLILSMVGFKNMFKSQIEFSYIHHNGSINPHLDGSKKLLSLMLYFPDNLKNKKFNDMQKKIGTNFIISSQKLKRNIHLVDSKQKEFFYKNSKGNISLKFEPLILFGFIKNNLSWHEVKKIKMYPNYTRKSINLNYFI